MLEAHLNVIIPRQASIKIKSKESRRDLFPSMVSSTKMAGPYSKLTEPTEKFRTVDFEGFGLRLRL